MCVFPGSLFISFLLSDHHCGFLTSFVWSPALMYLKYLLFFYVCFFFFLPCSYLTTIFISHFFWLLLLEMQTFLISAVFRELSHSPTYLQHCSISSFPSQSSTVFSAIISRGVLSYCHLGFPLFYSFANPHHQKDLPEQNSVSLSCLESLFVCLFFTIVAHID